MITSCSIFMNGLFTRYETVTARMRSLYRERLDLLDRAASAQTSPTTSR